MGFKISWSEMALEDYRSIIEYLMSERSEVVAIDFEKL